MMFTKKDLIDIAKVLVPVFILVGIFAYFQNAAIEEYEEACHKINGVMMRGGGGYGCLRIEDGRLVISNQIKVLK